MRCVDDAVNADPRLTPKKTKKKGVGAHKHSGA
jgi:hypothetical protein